MNKYHLEFRDIYHESVLVCTYSESKTTGFTVGQEYTLLMLYDQSRPTNGLPHIYTMVDDDGMKHNMHVEAWMDNHYGSDSWVQYIPKYKLTQEQIFMLRLSGSTEGLLDDQ